MAPILPLIVHATMEQAAVLKKADKLGVLPTSLDNLRKQLSSAGVKVSEDEKEGVKTLLIEDDGEKIAFDFNTDGELRALRIG